MDTKPPADFSDVHWPPDFADPPPVKLTYEQSKAKAESIIDRLPALYKSKIMHLIQTQGRNRHTTRATRALINLGLRAAEKADERAAIRVERREVRDLASLYPIMTGAFSIGDSNK